MCHPSTETDLCSEKGRSDMTDTKIVLAFPGREAFTKKMDDGFYREDPEARACFELAGDAFHRDFAAYCYRAEPVPGLWTGIALAVHCYAVYCVMKNRLSSIAGFVGYSQGEFMACAAAEAAGFLPILNTMVRLEQILQEPPTRRQDMFRIMELDRDTLESCCSEASDSGYVGISAYISGDQHVISGEQPALQQAVRLAKKRGARWVLPTIARCAAGRRKRHSPISPLSGRENPLFRYMVAWMEKRVWMGRKFSGNSLIRSISRCAGIIWWKV